MYKTFIIGSGMPIWTPLESNSKMERSIYRRPSGRGEKKANNRDYLLAGEREKGIWDTGSVFITFPAKFFSCRT